MKRKTAKEILAESFIELAHTKTIDKITVKDITENCGYSSATFYRQFKDKYDLIAWSYTQDIRSIVDKLEYTEGSWKQVLTEVAKYFDKHRDYLSNLLLHTNGYDSFVNNMAQIHYERLRFLILKVAPENKLDVMTEMYILEMYIGLRHSLISSNASASKTGSYSSFKDQNFIKRKTHEESDVIYLRFMLRCLSGDAVAPSRDDFGCH